MLGRIAACACALAIVGCGGGGKEPPPTTGVFQAGGVIGVVYSTATQQGVTDSAGTFQCVEGETVSFSVGMLTLGSAPCAGKISPFTLAGLTPPGGERALRRELDRARRTATPFTRAVNIDRLLLMLDADGDPRNGIDVRGRATTLTTLPDFGLRVSAFNVEAERMALDLTRGIPPWFPVAHLYSSIGLAVPVHAPVRTQNLEDLGGFPGSEGAMTYAPNGLLESESWDNYGDGAVDFVYSYRYDPLGRLVEYRGESDPDGDGVRAVTYLQRSTNDARGNPLTQVTTMDNDGDGQANLHFTFDSTFNRAGVLVAWVYRIDSNLDGIFDSEDRLSATYDARNNPVGAVRTSDVDGDGQVDRRTTTTTTYDSSGRILSSIADEDVDLDGDADARNSEIYEYGAGREATRLTLDSDYNADGTVDRRETYTWTYDGSGNQLTRRIERDDSGDGILDAWTHSTLTYDAQGRELTESRVESYLGGAIPDARSTFTRTFDDVGNPQMVVGEIDDGNDSVVDARSRNGFEYGTGGELLTSVFSFDSDGDGFTDFRNETRETHVVIADGALFLAQWYFSRVN